MNKEAVPGKTGSARRKKAAGKMLIVFRRTGERRYAVEARRQSWPDLEMNPAPGFDSLIPHDLMHLVVEAQLGLDQGIYGQLASGGDAGSFRPISTEHQSARSAARLRRHQQARGKPILRAGRTDCVQSERATYVCMNEWLRRNRMSGAVSSSTARSQPSTQVESSAPAQAIPGLDEQRLASICRHLDELSAVWSELKVGDSMSVSWPDLSVSKTNSRAN